MSQDVQWYRARTAARRVQKDDLSDGKRHTVRSWRFMVPILSKQNQTLRKVALERAFSGDTKWEDYEKKEKSALMKAIGYPAKVPA